jgi:hypothetical protein
LMTFTTRPPLGSKEEQSDEDCLNQRQWTSEPSWLGLMHTCKQTHHEAALLPMQTCTFYADNQKDFEFFFECLSRMNRPITSLQLKLPDDLVMEVKTPLRCIDLESQLPHLKTVKVNLIEAPQWLEMLWLIPKTYLTKDQIRRWLTNGKVDVVFT